MFVSGRFYFMELYMLTLKITLQKHINSNLYDLNNTVELIIPNILYNVNGNHYIYILIDKLKCISEQGISLLYTDEGVVKLEKDIEKVIKEFQKNSLSTKSKCIYEHKEDFSELKIYIKRL